MPHAQGDYHVHDILFPFLFFPKLKAYLDFEYITANRNENGWVQEPICPRPARSHL